jgi:hypothetical protein
VYTVDELQPGMSRTVMVTCLVPDRLYDLVPSLAVKVTV